MIIGLDDFRQITRTLIDFDHFEARPARRVARRTATLKILHSRRSHGVPSRVRDGTDPAMRGNSGRRLAASTTRRTRSGSQR